MYATLTRHMTSDDRKEFDRELAAPPDKPVSRGAGALRSLMQGGPSR